MRISDFTRSEPVLLLSQDDLAMPAVNLSNRLNPNNIHYDRELAARYKRMSKPEKEALWSRDREMQKLQVRAHSHPFILSPPKAEHWNY